MELKKLNIHSFITGKDVSTWPAAALSHWNNLDISSWLAHNEQASFPSAVISQRFILRMKTNEYELKVIAFRAPCEPLRLRIGSIFHLSKSDGTNYHRASGQLANAQKLQVFFPFSVYLQRRTKSPPAADMTHMVIEYSQAWRTYRLSIYFCGAAACHWYVWTVFVLRRFPLCSTTMSPSIRLLSRPQQPSLRSGCSFTLQFLTRQSRRLETCVFVDGSLLGRGAKEQSCMHQDVQIVLVTSARWVTFLTGIRWTTFPRSGLLFFGFGPNSRWDF